MGTAFVPVIIVALSPTGFDLGWLQTMAAVAGGAAGWGIVLAFVDHPLKREIAGIWIFLSAWVWRRNAAASRL